MIIDIFFATKRLSISSEGAEQTTYVATKEGRHAVTIERLNTLFESYEWVTIIALNDTECEEIYGAFASQFTPVTAAGGVVERNNKVLMIFRNGRWDLPKGHFEEGETIEECAIREVEEECGISQITIERELTETLHAYYMHKRWELKRTHWFSMRSNDSTPPTPQIEEGIERVEWLTPEAANVASQSSFPTILRVMECYSNPSK